MLCINTTQKRSFRYIFDRSVFLLVFFSYVASARCWMGAPFCPRIVKTSSDHPSIATVYCHGYEDSHAQYKRYLLHHNSQLEMDLLLGTVITFDFADAGKNPFRINRTCGCMAQQKEIDRVHAAIMYAHTLDVDMIILFGVSRGASAIIGALGQYSELYPKVIGVVLESPFATFFDVIQHIEEEIGITVSDWVASSIVHLLCARDWDPMAPHPIDFAPHIPEHLALQFIASDSDHLVPRWSTSKLVEIVRNNGCSISFNCIANGRHGRIVLGDSALEYTNILRAFYRTLFDQS